MSRPTDPREPVVGPTPIRVVRVTGEDRATFLDATLSQRIVDQPAGSVLGVLWLDAHGAPELSGHLVVEEESLTLLVDAPELVDVAVSGLGGRTFLSDAQFSATDDVVWRLGGDGVRAMLDAEGIADGAHRDENGVLHAPLEDGVLLAGSGDAVTARVATFDDAGATRLERAETEAFEIAVGIPAWGAEILRPHLPEELGLLPTHVHLAKGCYPGQEAVARMWMLGRPRRRLARLTLSGQVRPGWEAGSGRSKVAVTRTALWGGAEVGLGFVPSDSSVGDRFEGDEGAAEILGFVDDGRTVVGHDPAVVRRRDKRAAG